MLQLAAAATALALMPCVVQGRSPWEPPPVNPLTRHNKYIYIYQGPAWDVIANASLHARDANEIMEHTLNGGAGPAVDESAGMYHTDQYQLYNLMYHRLLKDPRRTLDPAQATSFVVPYDFATDSAYYKRCGKSNGVCYDFRRCPLAPQVEALLRESPWFRRKGGHDHLLVVGMNYAMDHYLGKPKCKALLADTCTNCTKIAIDDYSYMFPGNEGVLVKGDHWHAVPFPGDFHWTRRVERPFPWENDHRPLLVSYVGSTRSYYNPARRLRVSLVHFCEKHPADCRHTSYGVDGTRHSFKVEGHNPLQLSAQSVFCFQPIGDLMTRKGLFDSLFQGCIPVTFDALTAIVMYTWHWEEAFWKDVTIDFAHHPVAHRYVDPVERLREMLKVNGSEVRRKQALIRARVFELQYALDGQEEAWYQRTEQGMEFHNSWPREHGAAATPMRDAYGITMDHVLGWHSGLEADVRNATVPECWVNGELNVTLNRCVYPAPTPAPSKAP